ncbi:MAG TPA: DUF2442 domain-containing protein [Candidatus Kapabacteria bacterium]
MKVTRDHLQVLLEDGRIVVVPLEWYPRLANASLASLKRFEWIGKGLGIHWPDLDEDLSVEGFLQGWKAPANQFKHSNQTPRFLSASAIRAAG